ncbi:styrene monooxygenase/indole monooxygenase family protein [Chitinophaga sp. S165]|uniref:styrene monooxygenase/indole monooxygenase family protein n=1 Tax=Chitinophaga sp. S165 TaxID=2135462 RepID=UPI000D9B8926|nr:styrene monooxygenase/indole monooxygenase family protein [Chitinophaga sp. S165]PWV54472.1 2-polyprenyl-6-methoxyphenol hydroxylase-like FAD-dependent oxidoreductase [Chitinophaga sp. S165]
MNKIAIVGAGQAGLQLGFALLAEGYRVTIFTDKTSEEVLNGPTLPVAIQYFPSLQYEQDLRLNFWYSHDAAKLDMCIFNMFNATGTPLFNISARLNKAPQVVDLRLKYAIWMKEFEKRGGQLIIQPGTIELLEQCTSVYDAVFVTTGKGAMGQLFEKDVERSVLSRPQRHLTMFFVKNCHVVPGLDKDVRINNMNAIEDAGECIFYNFLHKDHGRVNVLLVEAIPGGVLDLSSNKASVREQFEYIRDVLRDLCADVYDKIRYAELLEGELLKGAVTPYVKKPVGKLPSGRVVMALGDALAVYDPLAAQGLNAASKAAHYVATRIIENDGRPFNEAWINDVFGEYWKTARHSYQIANAMICGLLPHQQMAFYAASQIPGIASDIMNNAGQLEKIAHWFNDPGQTMVYLCQKGFVMDESLV